MQAAVELFYRKILTDERVSRFFEDVDMEGQMAKQKAFLTMVFGGPSEYSGKDMTEGHSHLLDQGLNDSHVDAVIENLGATLSELGVDAASSKSALSIAEGARDDVLGRRGS